MTNRYVWTLQCRVLGTIARALLPWTSQWLSFNLPVWTLQASDSSQNQPVSLTFRWRTVRFDAAREAATLRTSRIQRSLRLTQSDKNFTTGVKWNTTNPISYYCIIYKHTSLVHDHHSKTCKNSGGGKTSAGLGDLRISKYCRTDAIFGISASKCTITDQGKSRNLRNRVQNRSP